MNAGPSGAIFNYEGDSLANMCVYESLTSLRKRAIEVGGKGVYFKPFLVSSCEEVANFLQSSTKMGLALERFSKVFPRHCSKDLRAGSPMVAATGKQEGAELLHKLMGSDIMQTELQSSKDATHALKASWLFGMLPAHTHAGMDFNNVGSVRVVASGVIRILATRVSSLRSMFADIKQVDKTEVGMQELQAFFCGFKDEHFDKLRMMEMAIECGVATEGMTLCIPPGWIVAFQVKNGKLAWGSRFLWLGGSDNDDVKADILALHNLYVKSGSADAKQVHEWFSAAGIL